MPGLAWRLLSKKTCLCTTAKRDSFYDDLPRSFNKVNEQESFDSYKLTRSDKPRRLIRQTNMDESDAEDDTTILEKLRRASSKSPANIPMLVVVSFNPDSKGLQKNQIEIQRGFPVNAQFIHKEWLFVRTADDEEGFVPYICCRPMLRRQPLKTSQVDIESSYKLYDFESSKPKRSKSPSISIPTYTPPIHRKQDFQNILGSQSCLLQHSQSCKKRQDVTSSSCGGDSGFSDCESSSHHQHHRSFDLSLPISARSSNIRSLRVSTNGSKKNGLVVHDLSSKKTVKTNESHHIFFKSDASHRTKSQLSVSSNSAFTQFVKKSANDESDQDSSQYQSSNSKSRLFYHRGEVSPPTSSISYLRRTHKSCDETGDDSSPSTKTSSTLSSPYIRRTPFSRRSLPHHSQPIFKKPLKPILSSSPDPFQTIKTQQQQLRHIVLAEPSIQSAGFPSTTKIERHFSDLSLNQIENDSLIPSTVTKSIVGGTHHLSSCSSTSPSSYSSDESSTAFVHIHMNNSRCQVPTRTDSVPFAFSAPNANTNTLNHNNSTAKSNSFIHNVSITV